MALGVMFYHMKVTLHSIVLHSHVFKTVWPSGLRRWLQAPVRKGLGSSPTAVTCFSMLPSKSLATLLCHASSSFLLSS